MFLKVVLWTTIVVVAAVLPRSERTEGREVIVHPPPLVRPISSFGAASFGDEIFVFGGHIGRTHAHSKKNLSNELRSWSPKSGAWVLRSSDVGLQGVSLSSVPTGLVRVGGLDARNEPGAPEDLHSTAAVALFDPSSNRWIDLPPLPHARSSHEAAVIGARVFIAGGWCLAGSEKRWAETIAVLDTSQPEKGWVEYPQPFKRRALAVAALGKKILVVGGLTDDGKMSSSVDLFDPADGSWSKGPDFPGRPFGAAMTSLGQAVVASGIDGRVYTLSSIDGPWLPVARHVFGRMFHRLIATGGDEVVSLGGANEGGHLAITEILALDGAPRVPCVALRVTNPSGVRNRFLPIRVGREIRLFGGHLTTEQHDFDPASFAKSAVAIDLSDLSSRKLSAMPMMRQSMHAVRLGESPEFFVFGGFGPEGTLVRSSAECRTYSWKDDAWQKSAADLPVPLTQSAAVRHDGATLIFGGLDYDPQKDGDAAFGHVRTVWRRSDVDGSMTPITELPRARRAAASVLVDGKLYLIGGLAAGFARVAEMDVYDLASGRWTTFDGPSDPPISADAVALGKKIYLPTSDGQGLQEFDLEKSAWRTLDIMLPFSTKHARMIVVDDVLCVISAQTNAGRFDLAFVRP